jgi:hypothetical protein
MLYILVPLTGTDSCNGAFSSDLHPFRTCIHLAVCALVREPSHRHGLGYEPTTRRSQIDRENCDLSKVETNRQRKAKACVK